MNIQRTCAPAIAGALFICLGVASTPADDAAQALLAKHRAYVGWQLADGTFKSLRLTREYTNAAGKVTSHLQELRTGLVFRNTSTSDSGTTGDTGFTGRLFWSTNWNGFTTPLYGDPAKFGLTLDAVLNEGLAGLPAASKASATVDGVATGVVRVTIPNGDDVDLYIDSATGSLAKFVIDPGGSYDTAYRVLSYVDGAPDKRLIGSYRIDADAGVYSYRDIQANVAVADADFHPPAPRASWSFANPNPFPILVTPTRFYVDATIDGVPGRFILDTGSSEIYLTSKFASKSNFKAITSTNNVGGIGPNTVRSDTVKLSTLTIGGNTLSNVYAQVNRGNWETEAAAPDGIIGFDLFGGAVVKLDSAASTMTIEDPSSAVDVSAGIPVLVDLSSRQPRVPMKLNGSIGVTALLDTGDPSRVLLSKSLVTHDGLRMLVDSGAVGYLQSHLRGGGVGGIESEECGHIDSLQLGPISYTSVNACMSPSFYGHNILVGYDFLRHFNMIFDYPHGQIVMTPHKD